MENTMNHIKSLIPIFAVVLAIAGFYYTTQHRLEHLEKEIISLKEQDKQLKKMINKKSSKSLEE